MKDIDAIVHRLILVCQGRKEFLYRLLDQPTPRPFRKYLYEIISENQLCFQNLHFTLPENSNLSVPLKLNHQIQAGKEFHKLPMQQIITLCLQTEKRSLSEFQLSKQGCNTSTTLELIVSHEIKSLKESIAYLQSYSNTSLEEKNVF